MKIHYLQHVPFEDVAYLGNWAKEDGVHLGRTKLYKFLVGKRMLKDNIKRINTILYCRNWEATVRFYRDILNFTIQHETEWFVEFHLMGDTCLSIANAASASVKSAEGDGITLSWQVEDVEFAHRRLEQFGVTASPIKRIWGAQAFCFFDPEGHRIELWT